MKKALMVATAVVVIVAAMGLTCGGKAPYYPLAEGNTWDYSGTTITVMTSTSEFIEDSYDTTATTTKTEVVGETTLPGGDETVWEIKNTVTVGDLAPSEGTSYVKVDGDSVYTYDDAGALTSTYPADPAVGDEWMQGTVTFKVEADGADANGYTGCLEVSSTPDDISGFVTYENLQYWAKDVGIVLMTSETVTELVVQDDTTTTTITIESTLDAINF